MTKIKMMELTDSEGDRVMIFLNQVTSIEDCEGCQEGMNHYNTRIYSAGLAVPTVVTEGYDLIIDTIREALIKEVREEASQAIVKTLESGGDLTGFKALGVDK